MCLFTITIATLNQLYRELDIHQVYILTNIMLYYKHMRIKVSRGEQLCSSGPSEDYLNCDPDLSAWRVAQSRLMLHNFFKTSHWI